MRKLALLFCLLTSLNSFGQLESVSEQNISFEAPFDLFKLMEFNAAGVAAVGVKKDSRSEFLLKYFDSNLNSIAEQEVILDGNFKLIGVTHSANTAHFVSMLGQNFSITSISFPNLEKSVVRGQLNIKKFKARNIQAANGEIIIENFHSDKDKKNGLVTISTKSGKVDVIDFKEYGFKSSRVKIKGLQQLDGKKMVAARLNVTVNSRKDQESYMLLFNGDNRKLLKISVPLDSSILSASIAKIREDEYALVGTYGSHNNLLKGAFYKKIDPTGILTMRYPLNGIFHFTDPANPDATGMLVDPKECVMHIKPIAVRGDRIYFSGEALFILPTYSNYAVRHSWTSQMKNHVVFVCFQEDGIILESKSGPVDEMSETNTLEYLHVKEDPSLIRQEGKEGNALGQIIFSSTEKLKKFEKDLYSVRGWYGNYLLVVRTHGSGDSSEKGSTKSTYTLQKYVLTNE